MSTRPSVASGALDDLIAEHDVVHVHQCLSPLGIFAAARARIAGKVVLGTDHGGDLFAELEYYPRLGRLFDVFHAQSDFAAAAFAGLDRPVRLIRGPVDDRMFALATTRRQRGLFVSIGRILPHKGYEHAIAALPRGARLVIAGRIYDRDYFDRLLQAAAGRDVHFETQLGDAEVQHLLGQASLLVHGGTHFGPDGTFYHKPELLALAPLEAMCLGTPAVVSRAGALGELAVLRGCRSYADAQELAAMLEAAAAGDLFALSPAEIRDDAVAQFGLRQFGEHYLALLRESGRWERAA
ncbi:glycosyltransferase involved in cell wall biosynthesis [Roseomonas alkaliterrae]|uniref:Glycosyltransferase involved in cell wall biosynthesis n=1 Tax=Neoroseomonas alkaliterrae TaxID=1452450 RepID=A0A840Y7K4_9PROT|nr:glycosyltransferase [Neoroseomonas alkaliterrae]MBB5691931.1 glycosyltransferase involved in cell wall biosynthesis [Neoroseomonas alkaliterrae]